MTIEFLLDEICLEHFAGNGHPENPERIRRIIEFFKLKELQSKINFKDVILERDLNKTLHEIHNEDLIKRVEKSKFKKETYFDQDTQANDKTYQAALKAASLAMTAAATTKVNNSIFSIMRPPGHHATPTRIMGFCFFNNISLATQYLLQKHNKIAIIDFDFHYGNGTADIFWKNPHVLYISIHADPSVNFPNQGFIDEIGSKEGKGYNVCIPLTLSAGNLELIYSLQQIVFPLLDEFKPDIIGMSAGFDGYYDDPVGGGYLQYTEDGFNKIGEMFFNYSLNTKTPLFHVLEGGYNTKKLPELIYNYIYPWLYNKEQIKRENVEINANEIKSREKKTIEYVRQMIKPYWNL